MNFIDSHCHLPNLHHKEGLERILNDAKEADVGTFINIGTSLKENFEAIETAEKYQSVYATVAIYPHEHRGENVGRLMEQLEGQAKSSKRVVAIGECGIDISEWKEQRPREEQMDLFEAQIKLSQKLNLPLIIHNRNGNREVLDALSRYSKVRGVVHCFDSDWETAQKFLEMGFYLSFSGFITYGSRTDLLETVKNVPSTGYLIETDSPYLLPEPARSGFRKSGVEVRNEPKYVRMVGQKVAEVRQISLEKIAEQSTNNTRRLFSLQ